MNLYKYNDDITELDLSNKKLNYIPDLSRFKKLEILNLSNNNISDIIPLQNLNNSNLVSLHLTNNNISDIRPLQYLTNLIVLSLNYNNISDLSPLQHLINLEKLDLENNIINDITKLLQSLTNLRMLYISIEPFVIKEINPQLSINQQLDNEIIKQIYQTYTNNEIKDYQNKVIRKFKKYKFIDWSTFK